MEIFRESSFVLMLVIRLTHSSTGAEIAGLLIIAALAESSYKCEGKLSAIQGLLDCVG